MLNLLELARPTPKLTLEERAWRTFQRRLRPPVDFDIDVPRYADEVLDPPARYKVLYGGRGAGRSWSVARKLLKRASRRRIRVLCTREHQTSIKDSVHALLKDQIEKLGLPDFDVTEREIRHRVTGAQFLFEGLRYNITDVKSIESIDICWVEDAERVSSNSWRVLTPSIRKPGSEIWVNFNPDLNTDATYKMFVVNPPPSAIVRKVGWEDNPWLPQVLRDEKDWDYLTDPEAAAWVWGGSTRTHSKAQVLSGKWVVDTFEPQDTWSGPYYGIDFGFSADPATCGRLWEAPVPGAPGRFDLMTEHEAYKHHLENDEMAAYFIEHVPGVQSSVTRADNSRPETISYLRKPRPDQPHLPHVIAANKWPGSVEDGIAHLRAYRRIVIHARCKQSINEATLYSYKVDERTGDVTTDIADKHNHLIDMWRYALDEQIRKRPKPRRRGTIIQPSMGM